MRLIGQIGSWLLPLWLTSCAQTIHLSDAPKTPNSQCQEKLWQSHYLLGFVGKSSIDLRDHCPGRTVAEVTLTHNYATVLLWAVTYFIYTPRRVIITCGPEVTPK